MIIIYSNEKVKGLEGVYANPLYFLEVNKSATKVYANNEAIKEAYESVDIEVEAYEEIVKATDDAKTTTVAKKKK